jgi:organic radical activating enzyme
MELKQINKQKPEKPWYDPYGRLKIHDIWYTIQGEGPYTGHPAVFVRLASCNLQCPACDTDYSNKEGTLYLDRIITRIERLTPTRSFKYPYPLVVLTGGEPFLQNIGPLAALLCQNEYNLQIESNGTLVLPTFDNDSWLTSTVVVSPKTPGINPGMKPLTLAYKYVMRAGEVSLDDGLPTKSILGQYPARPPLGNDRPIYVQPCDEQDEAKNKANLDACIASCMKHGYILSEQNHKRWGLL